MTTRSPFDSDRPGISRERVVDAPVSPPPLSTPWHPAPDEAPETATRRADHRYADPADAVELTYVDPADEIEHRYPDPLDEIDYPYPDPADEAAHRYSDRADMAATAGTAADRRTDRAGRRYADPADEVDHRYGEPTGDGARPHPHPAPTPGPAPADKVDERFAAPAAVPANAPADAPADDAADDADDDMADPAYDNPVDGLVHAAVADRPLDEVIQLIELLEQSPEYARATADALRAVGTDRSVEDVSRLVALLTRPPRDADSADEAIRAAAEARPVEDVTRLMGLLHRPPLERHCGEAAVQAAATSRPVEELVELIGRMAQAQGVREDRQRAKSPTREGPKQAADGARGNSAKDGPPSGDRLIAEGGTVAIGRTARARRGRTAKSGGAPAWPRWVAALVLVVCGLAHFPPHRDGASLSAYGFAIGACGLCVLVGLALLRRSALPVLALGIAVPAALAVAQLLEGRVRSPGLTRALDLTLAPPWLAGLAAVLAALAALTALVALLAAGRQARPRPDLRQLAGSNRTAD
jgi:hypothetical protein